MKLGRRITQQEALSRGEWIHVFFDANGRKHRERVTLVGPSEPVEIRWADKPLRVRNVGIFAVPNATAADASIRRRKAPQAKRSARRTRDKVRPNRRTQA
jgi:hypothetical protein